MWASTLRLEAVQRWAVKPGCIKSLWCSTLITWNFRDTSLASWWAAESVPAAVPRTGYCLKEWWKIKIKKDSHGFVSVKGALEDVKRCPRLAWRCGKKLISKISRGEMIEMGDSTARCNADLCSSQDLARTFVIVEELFQRRKDLCPLSSYIGQFLHLLAFFPYITSSGVASSERYPSRNPSANNQELKLSLSLGYE